MTQPEPPNNQQAVARSPAGRVTTIYEAAAEVFLRETYAGATTSAIASAAGVAESTLFRLVKDKASLYRSLFDYAWSEINAVVAGAAFVAKVDDPVRSMDPAEIVIGDLMAIAASYEQERMRLLVTFAFDAISRASTGEFELDSAAPYARFKDRLRSYCQLHLESSGRPTASDAGDRADVVLARLRSTWMGWHHTHDMTLSRLPTPDELEQTLRGQLRPLAANTPEPMEVIRSAPSRDVS